MGLRTAWFAKAASAASRATRTSSERSSFTTGQTHVADGGCKFVP